MSLFGFTVKMDFLFQVLFSSIKMLKQMSSSVISAYPRGKATKLH